MYENKKIFLLKMIILVPYCLISFAIGTDTLIWVQITLFMYLILDLLENPKQNILLICFSVTFFVFLMAGPIAQEYFGAIEKRSYTAEAIIHSHWTIIVSLLTLIISNKIIRQRFSSDNYYVYSKESDNELNSIRVASKRLYWIAYCFMFLYSARVALYVIMNGYLSFYTSYSAGMWVVVEKIGDMAPLAMAAFIASYPDKKEAKPLLISYILYGFSTLLTGKRYEAVFVCMFVLVVYVYRGWIKKKHIIALAIIVPVCLVGLQMIDLLRAGAEKAKTMSTTGNLIVDFMNYVGNSNKVIRLQYMYRDEIPKFKFYSFGSLLDYFKYNFISKALFGFQSDRWSRAFEGHSLSTVVSYIYSSDFFNSGQGMGSCYIAELYNDFNYFGVVVGNVFIVYLVKRVFNLDSSSFLKRGICLFILSPLLLMPRGNFDEMLLYIFNIKHILLYLIMMTYAHRLNSD